MVQKSSPPSSPPPRRGRPRAYDPERALDGATGAFWRSGFAGTSLDDLTASTDMNRPSLYAAFGDKQALYLKTIERYAAASAAGMARELAGERPLAEELRALYRRALELYRAGLPDARGCYLSSTVATAALDDPAVKAALVEALRRFDAVFERRFALARSTGELAPEADPRQLAVIACSMIHSLAVRARAGEARERLEEIADAAVAVVCPSAPRAPARARRGSR